VKCACFWVSGLLGKVETIVLTLTVLVIGLTVLVPVQIVQAVTIIGTDATVGTAECPPGPCGLTLSWTHTVGSNVNRILIVGISASPVSAGVPSITMVRFGSSSLTPLTPQGVSYAVVVQQWYLLNPPSGSAMVTITFATGSSPASAVGASVSFFNLAGVGASNGATGYGFTASVTVSANSGDLVVDTIGAPISGINSPDPSQTQLWNLNTGSLLGAGSDKPASSPVTMQWTLADTVPWGLVSVDLQPLAAPIPEYPLGLLILAMFMVVGYGLIRRKTVTKKQS
jgi:hypothetical protein